jgi:tricorn protease
MVSSLLLTVAVTTVITQPRLLQTPDVSGDQVVFSYAGDIWIASLTGGTARQLTSHPGMETFPKFSRDGSMIAFTGSYDGTPELYVMPSTGGEPRRLTYDPGAERVVDWRPDGMIAYVSTHGNHTNRKGRMNLISPEGGMPIATQLDEVFRGSFSPDGNRLAYNRANSENYNWRRYRGGTQGIVSLYDFQNNTYTQLPHGREQNYSPMWVGDKIYFLSDKHDYTQNLYEYDLNTRRERRLTDFKDADARFASTDGKTIVWERDGYIETFDIATSRLGRFTPEVRGEFTGTRPQLRNLTPNISSMSLSPSGARLAVEARGHIFSVPAETGETRELAPNMSGRQRFAQWSPDGQNIAFLSDTNGEYQIFSVPQRGGTPTLITPQRDLGINSFRYLPDGKSFLISNSKAEVRLIDPVTGRNDLVFRGNFGFPNLGAVDVSPCGRYLAYVNTEPNLFNAIYIYDINTRRNTKVTEGYFADESVSFDLNGRYLYFTSVRTFIPRSGQFEFGLDFAEGTRIYAMILSADTPSPLERQPSEEPIKEPPAPPAEPKPEGEAAAQPAAQPQQQQQPRQPAKPVTRIDFDGLEARSVVLPMPPGSYGQVIGANNGVFFFTAGGMFLYRFDQDQPAQIISGVSNVTFNQARNKFAYLSGPPGNRVLGIADVRPGIQAGQGRVNTSGIEAIIDPRAEWEQIFWESWRFQRDRFYDPAMLGLNWRQIGEHYAKMLPYVRHRADLNHILGLMVGELGTGHAYVSGGDMNVGVAPTVNVSNGSLGADYEVVGNAIRFKRIYPGLNFDASRRGPLGAPGVNIKEGEYLVAVNGQPVDAKNPPNSRLLNQAGKTVILSVSSSPTGIGARQVRVVPISDETELRYITWVEDNRRYVEEKSGGRLGYLHVPDTSIPGMIEFTKGFYSQSDKEGWVIDERYNGGGMIPTFFIERLARTPQTALKSRDLEIIGFPTQALDGPKVMLINQYAGSGGDMLPWLFRRNNLGPLIGTRTWGGLVGIQGSAPLVDGGTLTSPGFGIFDLETGKWIAENEGVDPDIAVDNDPASVARGLDRQLDTAIEYLLKELAKGQRERPRPVFPVAPNRPN